MKVRRVRIENYRSIREADFKLLICVRSLVETIAASPICYEPSTLYSVIVGRR